jgi:hypothetical protein
MYNSEKKIMLEKIAAKQRIYVHLGLKMAD